MSENNLRQYIISGLKGVVPDGRVTAHEDAVAIGVPDVSYTLEGASGWIELKHLDGWPARETTIVRMKRYTPEQRRWLMEEGLAGGRGWVLLQVGNWWGVFGHFGAQLVGQLPRHRLLTAAVCVWTHKVDFVQLTKILRRSSNDQNVIEQMCRDQVHV